MSRYSQIPTQDKDMSLTTRWESLRKEARQLEYDIDSRLVTFAKLVGTNAHHLSNTTSTADIELDDLLKRVIFYSRFNSYI